MGRLEQEDCLRVNNEPVDGEAQDHDQTKQEAHAIQSKNRSRQIPQMLLLVVVLDASSGGLLLEIQALLQLLKESNQRESGNADGNEINQRIGYHEINDKSVRLAHSLHVRMALVVGDGRGHGEGRVLQLVQFVRLSDERLVVEHSQQESGNIFVVDVGERVDHDQLLLKPLVRSVSWSFENRRNEN